MRITPSLVVAGVLTGAEKSQGGRAMADGDAHPRGLGAGNSNPMEQARHRTQENEVC